MLTIAITRDDVEALARTAMSEVGHFGRYGEETLKGGVEAVVDTILNRAAHLSFPDTIGEVVNARFQFSAIGGPGGVRTWRRLPKASSAVAAIVEKHLNDRLNGKASTIEGATHFLNPHFSSARALSTWGDHVVRHAIARWGQGRDIHFHGYAPGYGPPPAYRLELEGKTHDFAGKGTSLAKAATGAVIGAGAVVVGAALAGALASGQTEADTAGSSGQQSAGEATGVPIVEVDEDETLAYHVEEVPAADTASVQAVLNRLSAEGWRMRQILPLRKKLLIIFEGKDADQLVHEVDDRSDDEVPALAAPAIVTDNTPEARFAKFLTDLRLVHFHPQEFLVLGGQNLTGPAKGKNTLPPEDLWPNIRSTARVLDALRAKLDAPIHLSSVYRSPAYNALIPGAAGGSTHMQFRAADFSCSDGRGPVWWAQQLNGLRDEGLFMGGIGIYPTFVHVDTRGQNVAFGPWRRRVFG
jgi:hypothetical protein